MVFCDGCGKQIEGNWRKVDAILTINDAIGENVISNETLILCDECYQRLKAMANDGTKD